MTWQTMNMKCAVTKFLSHLSIECSCAASTIHDYDKELNRLNNFLKVKIPKI